MKIKSLCALLFTTNAERSMGSYPSSHFGDLDFEDIDETEKEIASQLGFVPNLQKLDEAYAFIEAESERIMSELDL